MGGELAKEALQIGAVRGELGGRAARARGGELEAVRRGVRRARDGSALCEASSRHVRAVSDELAGIASLRRVWGDLFEAILRHSDCCVRTEKPRGRGVGRRGGTGGVAGSMAHEAEKAIGGVGGMGEATQGNIPVLMTKNFLL